MFDLTTRMCFVVYVVLSPRELLYLICIYHMEFRLLICVLVSDVEDVEESVECVLCKTVIEKLDQLLEGKTAVVSQSNLIKSTQTFPIPNV